MKNPKSEKRPISSETTSKNSASPTPARQNPESYRPEDFAFIRKVVINTEAAPDRPGLLGRLMQRLRLREEISDRTRGIEATRSNLNELTLNVHELKRKIERLEGITNRWRERSMLNFRR